MIFRIRQQTKRIISVECVGVRSYHHNNFLQWIWSPPEFSPVYTILISTAVVSSTIPNSIEIWMSTCIVPPSSLLVMSTITCKRKLQFSLRSKWKILQQASKLSTKLFFFKLCVYTCRYYVVQGEFRLLQEPAL